MVAGRVEGEIVVAGRAEGEIVAAIQVHVQVVHFRVGRS